MDQIFSPAVLVILNWFVTIFFLIIGLFILGLIVVYILDVSQKKNAVLHNYPVVGHFRGIFSTLGEFFRQYFFAMDREEMPFNRAERNWVAHASKKEDVTVAFGSTRSLTPVGTSIFVNCPFPTLESDAAETQPVIIGPYVKNPFTAKSFFNISGMSFGAISKPAVLALSNGARMAGLWMNTGEGGLSPYHLEGGADIVFQIGTAKYGVRNSDGSLNEDKLRDIANHETVRMFEIKFSQGAKPGKGGILPGIKVTSEISKIRGIPQGEDSISPNRHPEVDCVPDILDFIAKIRNVVEKPVGFKCVVGAYGWLEKLCQEIHRRGIESAPDFMTIDSGDGGTGAAPLALMDNVGLPIRESLPMVVDILLKYNLKDRIKIVSSGKLITPAEVAWALCTGADFITSARGFMFSLGCIQAMKCNKNTCPTGITTHNPHLQKGLVPTVKAIRVKNYAEAMIHEVEVIAHSCGVHEPRCLKRFHMRIVQNNGRSLPLNELYPEPDVISEYVS